MTTALPRPLFGRRLFGMDPSPMQMYSANSLPMRPSEVFASALRDHPVMAASATDPAFAGTAFPSSLAASTLPAATAIPSFANMAIPAEVSPDYTAMGTLADPSTVVASAPAPMAGAEATSIPAVAPAPHETLATIRMPGHGMVEAHNPIAPTVPISISTTRPAASLVATPYPQPAALMGSLPHNMYMPGQGNPAASMDGSRSLPFTQFSGSVAAETVALPHRPDFAGAPSTLPQTMHRHSARASQLPVDSSDMTLGEIGSAPYPGVSQGTPLPIVEDGPATGVVGEPVGMIMVPTPQPVPKEPGDPLNVVGTLTHEHI